MIEVTEALHAKVRAAIAGAPFDFDELASAIARFQAEHSPGYARLCAARGVDPLRDPPSRLPAVPTDAFKLTRVATFPPALDVAVFRTSGTTVGQRGAHPMRTLATYHDAAIAFARATLFAPYRSKPRVIAVAPRAEDSSLSRMMEWFVSELGDEGSCFVSPTDRDAALEAIAAASGAVVVLATAFAWVELLGARLRVAPGSRAMQTGGFKGRTREIPADELRREIASLLSIPPRDVVGEYGMTELSSQLWATPEVGSSDDAWIYRAPPWVRVVACDPSTLAPLARGQRGIARVEDLANVESAWAVQTADEVIVHEDGGVELFGRLPGATPRGCSLAVEELL